jgi:hypothetical protein
MVVRESHLLYLELQLRMAVVAQEDLVITSEPRQQVVARAMEHALVQQIPVEAVQIV